MTHQDIFDKCKTPGGYFGEFRTAGDRYYTMPVIESPPGREIIFQGKRHLMWAVNNYLGLAENEEVKQAGLNALREWGVSGPMGSRMMSGNTPAHIELERELADFQQKESAILFNYGYLGVAGTVSALVEPEDIIVLDKLAHASIVDAAIGAVADRRNIRVFRHNDMGHLETLLQRINQVRRKGVFILTEGVYGMTGDIAKLKDICELKDRYEARLFVDDAHGIGVMGAQGRGAADHCGVQDRVDIVFGTFAKAFAAIGGFAASRRDVVEWIRYNARTQVFAKSLPMVYVQSLKKTLELVRQGEARRKQLFLVAKALRDGLRELSFFVGEVPSPIVPVFVPEGTAAVAMDWIRYLREKGVFVAGVMYPAIPKGIVLFRMIPTASHTLEDVSRTVEAFRELKQDRHLCLEVPKQAIARIYGGGTDE